jgi:hypothetical protein
MLDWIVLGIVVAAPLLMIAVIAYEDKWWQYWRK